MKEDLGKFFLRLSFGGGMLLAHGLPKLSKFSQLKNSFPDPLSIGSSLSLGLTIFSEVLCAALIVLGVTTRFASIPLMITMLVAFFVIHGGDPFAKKELAFFYLVGYSVICLNGDDKYSLSHFFKK